MIGRVGVKMGVRNGRGRGVYRLGMGGVYYTQDGKAGFWHLLWDLEILVEGRGWLGIQ